MKEEIKIMKPENLLVYQKGFTPQIIDKLITDNNLNGLRIFDDLDPLENVDFLNDCFFLKELSIATRWDFGFEYLKKLPNLISFSTQVIGKSKIDLSYQVNLERLSVEWHNDIMGLGNCKKLKRLGIVDLTEKNLIKVVDLVNLETLSIKTSKIDSLEGIEKLAKLKDIHLGNCKKLTSVTSLNGLSQLENIEFNMCVKIQDFSSLKQLPSLTTLHLIDCKLIDSIKFIDNFPLLSLVAILGNTEILDGDMQPLIRIRHLTYNHRKHYNQKIATPEADERSKRNIEIIKESWKYK